MLESTNEIEVSDIQGTEKFDVRSDGVLVTDTDCGRLVLAVETEVGLKRLRLPLGGVGMAVLVIFMALLDTVTNIPVNCADDEPNLYHFHHTC